MIRSILGADFAPKLYDEACHTSSSHKCDNINKILISQIVQCNRGHVKEAQSRVASGIGVFGRWSIYVWSNVDDVGKKAIGGKLIDLFPYKSKQKQNHNYFLLSRSMRESLLYSSIY
jgi:hypothetical protein